MICLAQILHYFCINTKPGLQEINIFNLHEIADEYLIKKKSQFLHDVVHEYENKYYLFCYIMLKYIKDLNIWTV